MRFGLCVNMGAGDAAGIGHERIEPAAALGFSYVELPLAQMMALSEAAFAEGPLRALREAGIPCDCCNNFFPASVRLTGERPDPSAIEYAKRAMDRAARAGARRLVFGSSGARNVPDGFPVETAWAQIAELLAAIGPLAQERGIVLVIEPLNRLESNILNSLGEGLRMAREVCHPAVACLVDYYHAALSGDACDALSGAGGLLKHTHLARPLGRAMPVCTGEEPYLRFFQALRAIGYDERLSLEAFVRQDFASEASRALALMKELSAQGAPPPADTAAPSM